MASRSDNEVTLTFAGDHEKLTKSMSAVGEASQQMQGRMSKASERVSRGLDKTGQSADRVDTSAMGFRDTVTGVADTMQGLNDQSLSTSDRLFTLGQGVGDLASSMVNLAVPALKQMTKGTKSLSRALLTNPIFLLATAVIAIGAALVVAYQKSETFRRIVTEAFDAVMKVIGPVIDGLKSAGSWVASLFTGDDKKRAEDFKKASEETMEALSERTDQAADAVDDLRDSIFKLENQALALDEAEDQLASSIDSATEAAKENGEALTSNTQSGRDNRSALRDLASGHMDLVESMMESGEATKDITGATDSARREFIDIAKQMGATKSEAKALADEYGLVPSQVKTDIEAIGAADTIADLARINEEFRNLSPDFRSGRVSIGAGVATTGGSFHQGGIVSGAMGRESLALVEAGEQISPAGGGSGDRTVIELRSGGTSLDDALVEIMARSIRNRGGDVQLVLGNS